MEGWTLLGSTNKTFNWLNATDSWTSSEHIEIASGKNLKVDGTTFFVDGTNNRVGIGLTAPATLLHLKTTSGDCDLQIEATGSNTDARLNLYAHNGGVSQIRFGDDADTNVGLLTYEHSSNSLQFRTADAERMRIDSSGRLLLGTTTEGQSNADDLTIAGTGHAGITVRSGTSNNGSIFFSDGTSGVDEYRGWLQYTHTSDYLTFGVNAAEKFRIGSAGQLGVGGATYGTSGQVLTSGGSGAAPSWADVTIPPAGNTFTAVANGSIANNKAVQIRTDGKVEQIASSYSASSVWSGSNTVQIATDGGSKQCTNVWVGGSHRLVVNVWQDTSGNIKARSYHFNSTYNRQDGTAQTIVSGTTSDVTVSYDPVQDRILFVYIQNVGGNYQLRATVATPDGTNKNLTSIQSAVTIESASGNSNASPSVFYETTSQKHIIIYRTNPSGGAPGANWDCKYRVMSLSGNTLTTNSSNTFDADDSTRFNFCRTGANTIAVAYRAGDGTGYVKAGTIGSTTITWGSRVDFTAGGSASIAYGNRGTIGCAFDIANSKLCIVYIPASGKRARALYASISTNTVTIENAGNNADISGGSNGNDNAWVHAIYEPLAGKIWTIMTLYHGNYGKYVIFGRRIDYTSSGNFSQQGLQAIDTGQWNQDISWNAAVGEDGNIFPTGLDESDSNYHYFYRAYLLVQSSNLVGNDLYVGFADQAYTNGQTATIKTYGNHVDTLSGLTPGTKYYVQGDGTVGTSAFTPTTRAGIAIATNKLLIQEPTNWGG